MLEMLLLMVETDDDKELVTKLFETYRQRMYNLAYGILKNDHDAEDAVSNAFMRIINNLHKISDPESNKTRGYVYTITKNAAINVYNERKKHFHDDIDELNIASEQDLEDSIINKYDRELVNRAIGRLNENYQNILILRYYYDLPLNNIAVSLGITLKAAKNRLYRAQESLLKELGGQNDE